MFTAQDLKQIKNELKQYGYSSNSADLCKLIELSTYQGNITLFYSVIDFTGRDDLAARTALKFKYSLKALELIHKKAGKVLPEIKILLCDDLQRHNFPNLSEAELEKDLNTKRAQLAKILGISEITGPTVYQLDGQTYKLNIQRWAHLLTEDVKVFVKTVKDKLDKAAEDPKARQNFCNDSYLFNPDNGILRNEVAILKELMMKQSGTTNITDRNLVGLGPNLTLAAIQFLIHTLKVKANLDASLDHKTDHATYCGQKEIVLGNAALNGQGVSNFKNGIVYVMEEIFAFCNDPGIYIYGAGTVTMHASHPFYGMHHLYMAGKQPFGCLASPEFNDLTEEKLLQYRNNQPRPSSNPIKIPTVSTFNQAQVEKLSTPSDSEASRGLSKPTSPSMNPSPNERGQSVDNSGGNSDTDSYSINNSVKFNPFILAEELLLRTTSQEEQESMQEYIIKDMTNYYKGKKVRTSAHNTTRSDTPNHMTSDVLTSPNPHSSHTTVRTQRRPSVEDDWQGTKQPIIHTLSFSNQDTSSNREPTTTIIEAYPVTDPTTSPIFTTQVIKL